MLRGLVLGMLVVCVLVGAVGCQSGYCDSGLQDYGDGECKPVDPCAEDAVCAGEHRECMNDRGDVVCGGCLDGYHEDQGDCVEDLKCQADSCSGHGDCDDSTGTALVCACEEGYTGTRCEACDQANGWHLNAAGDSCTNDPCDPNPCTDENQSQCADDGSGSAVCSCDPGFTDYGDGACRPSNPCAEDIACAAEHRECQNDQGAAVCGDCLAGYYEDQGVCLEEDACHPNPCTTEYQTWCQDDGAGNPVCWCDVGYQDYGDGACKPSDPCIGDTSCAALNRECVNDNGAAVCGECQGGWNGSDCDVLCVRRVDVDADPGGDGLTWASAFTEVRFGIQSAYDAVQADPDLTSCEVWVAAGTYYICRTDQSDTVRLMTGVHLFGGFAGNETSREQRDWSTQVTVLDGHEHAGGGHQVYHVVTASDDTTLDGFIITGGDASGHNIQHQLGGGIVGFESSIEVRNCTVTGNSSDLTGGGIFLEGNSTSSIIDCVIENNINGGGVHAEACRLNLRNCIISNNSAGDIGGGISGLLVDLSVTNCTIAGNSAANHGAGIACGEGSKLELVNSISWNDASGEIYFPTPEWGSPNSMTISHSDIQGGQASVHSGEDVELYWLDGNLDSDPLFLDAGAGDYHLTSGSPCIDTGTSSAAPDTDFEGDLRPWGEGYDIGADEFTGG